MWNYEIPFTEQQWSDLISEGLHVSLLDDVGANVAAKSALMGFWNRYGWDDERRSLVNIYQLANEINRRLW